MQTRDHTPRSGRNLPGREAPFGILDESPRADVTGRRMPWLLPPPEKWHHIPTLADTGIVLPALRPMHTDLECDP